MVAHSCSANCSRNRVASAPVFIIANGLSQEIRLAFRSGKLIVKSGAIGSGSFGKTSSMKMICLSLLRASNAINFPAVVVTPGEPSSRYMITTDVFIKSLMLPRP